MTTDRVRGKEKMEPQSDSDWIGATVNRFASEAAEARRKEAEVRQELAEIALANIESRRVLAIKTGEVDVLRRENEDLRSQIETMRDELSAAKTLLAEKARASRKKTRTR